MTVRLPLYLLLITLSLPLLATEPGIAEPQTETASVTASQYATDLLQLYHESRLEDPRVLMAHARMESSREQQREAFGGLLPQMSLNAGRNRITQDSEINRQSYNNERLSVSLTQVIYNKAAWENWNKYRSLTRQSESELDNALAEATVDLAQRYFAALAADDELTLIESELHSTRLNLEQVEALYAKQMVRITDKLEIQSRVDTLTARQVEARNQVRLSRVALSEIIGRPVLERLHRVRDDVELQVSEQNVEQWIELAISQSPQISAAENAVLAAQAALREGRGAHYPTVSLSLSAQETNEGYNNTLSPETETYVAGLSLQIPLYSGGSTSARVRSLRQELIVREQQLEAIRREVIRETTNAYLTAESSIEKLRANRTALSSSRQARQAAEQAFAFGVVDAVDVLTATQNEFAARRDLLRTQYEFIINLFTLNRWAGKLSSQSVESVNNWLTNSNKGEAITALSGISDRRI